MRHETLKIIEIIKHFSAVPVTLDVIIINILRSLGFGKDRNYILSSVLLIILSIFYFFVVGSFIQTPTYTFQYRVTYESIFVTHILDLKIDTFILLSLTLAWIYVSINIGYKEATILLFFSLFLIFLLLNLVTVAVVGAALTFPFAIGLIVVDRFLNRRILKHNVRLSLNYFAITTIIFACSGIISLLFLVITGVSTVTVEKYTYAIYQELFSILTPIIMGSLVFILPLKVVLNEIFSKLKIKESLLFCILQNKLPNKHVAIYLSLCITLGVVVAFIPHLLTVNPNNEHLGVDSAAYSRWLKSMKNQTVDPISFAFRDVNSGDRPLTIIFLFIITEATQIDPFQAVEYSALVLTPLLVLVTFFLTRQITNNDNISILASFLSAISFQTIIGIYSGFYANWFALILGYSGFTLLVKYLTHPSKLVLITLAIIMTGVLLTHAYTWTIMTFVAFIFLFVLHSLHYFPRKRFLLLYLILSSTIVVDVLKSSWIGSSTGVQVDVSVGLSHGLGISQFSERLRTLAETVQTYYGGAYANIAILGLIMYWLIRSQPRELANIFIMIFLSTALIPLFIGDYVLQSRVLFDIPFQIPGAISLYYIGRKNGKMISIALLLISGYLSFHVLANLGYVPSTNPLGIIQGRD